MSAVDSHVVVEILSLDCAVDTPLVVQLVVSQPGRLFRDVKQKYATPLTLTAGLAGTLVRLNKLGAKHKVFLRLRLPVDGAVRKTLLVPVDTFTEAIQEVVVPVHTRSLHTEARVQLKLHYDSGRADTETPCNPSVKVDEEFSSLPASTDPQATSTAASEEPVSASAAVPSAATPQSSQPECAAPSQTQKPTSWFKALYSRKHRRQSSNIPDSTVENPLASHPHTALTPVASVSHSSHLSPAASHASISDRLSSQNQQQTAESNPGEFSAEIPGTSHADGSGATPKRARTAAGFGLSRLFSWNHQQILPLPANPDALQGADSARSSCDLGSQSDAEPTASRSSEDAAASCEHNLLSSTQNRSPDLSSMSGSQDPCTETPQAFPPKCQSSSSLSNIVSLAPKDAANTWRSGSLNLFSRFGWHSRTVSPASITMDTHEPPETESQPPTTAEAPAQQPPEDALAVEIQAVIAHLKAKVTMDEVHQVELLSQCDFLLECLQSDARWLVQDNLRQLKLQLGLFEFEKGSPMADCQGWYQVSVPLLLQPNQPEGPVDAVASHPEANDNCCQPAEDAAPQLNLKVTYAECDQNSANGSHACAAIVLEAAAKCLQRQAASRRYCAITAEQFSTCIHSAADVWRQVIQDSETNKLASSSGDFDLEVMHKVGGYSRIVKLAGYVALAMDVCKKPSDCATPNASSNGAEGGCQETTDKAHSDGSVHSFNAFMQRIPAGTYVLGCQGHFTVLVASPGGRVWLLDSLGSRLACCCPYAFIVEFPSVAQFVQFFCARHQRMADECAAGLNAEQDGSAVMAGNAALLVELHNLELAGPPAIQQ